MAQEVFKTVGRTAACVDVLILCQPDNLAFMLPSRNKIFVRVTRVIKFIFAAPRYLLVRCQRGKYKIKQPFISLFTIIVLYIISEYPPKPVYLETIKQKDVFLGEL